MKSEGISPVSLFFGLLCGVALLVWAGVRVSHTPIRFEGDDLTSSLFSRFYLDISETGCQLSVPPPAKHLGPWHLTRVNCIATKLNGDMSGGHAWKIEFDQAVIDSALHVSRRCVAGTKLQPLYLDYDYNAGYPFVDIHGIKCHGKPVFPQMWKEDTDYFPNLIHLATKNLPAKTTGQSRLPISE